jgi:hypothetical protein
MFIPIYPAAGPLGSWMVWQWEPFLWQAGGDIINEEQSRVLYNSPEVYRHWSCGKEFSVN